MRKIVKNLPFPNSDLCILNQRYTIQECFCQISTHSDKSFAIESHGSEWWCREELLGDCYDIWWGYPWRLCKGIIGITKGFHLFILQLQCYRDVVIIFGIQVRYHECVVIARELYFFFFFI